MFLIKTQFKGDFWKEVKKAPQIYEQEMRKSMEAGVMHIQGKVVEKTPRNFGTHAASITSKIEGVGLDIYGRAGSPMPTMQVLEDGRTAGKRPPPVDVIKNWFVRKGLSPEEGRTIEQSVFLIARGIGRKGTKAIEMFKKTFVQEERKIIGLFNEARDRIVKRMS